MQSFNPDAAMDTVRQLFDKANVNHGWSLAPSQVRALVVFIQQIDASLAAAFAQNEQADAVANMLAAYMSEYGEELYNELLVNNEAVVEGVVEGDVEAVVEEEVVVSGDEIEGEIGQTS